MTVQLCDAAPLPYQSRQDKARDWANPMILAAIRSVAVPGEQGLAGRLTGRC